MQKLQPDGGYETIETTNPIYAKMTEQTGVWKLTPTQKSMKLKAGQNLPKERKEALIERLLQRGEAMDIDTAGIMQK